MVAPDKHFERMVSTGMGTWFPSHTAALLFTVVFCLWAAGELYNTFRFRRSRHTPGVTRRDHGSYWVIFLIVWGSMIVSFAARALNLGVFHNYLQFLGMLLTASGVVLREWAVLSLGRSFTVTVSIASDQPLVEHGPYRRLRHPSYSGSILSLVGFPLALGTWLGGLLVLVLSACGFLYRARIEEKALLEAFGEAYRDYMRRTWRFLPGL